jgi:hypothetical protein
VKPPHRESLTSARSERTPLRSDGNGSTAGVQGWGAARSVAARGIEEEIGRGDRERLHVSARARGLPWCAHGSSKARHVHLSSGCTAPGRKGRRAIEGRGLRARRRARQRFHRGGVIEGVGQGV